LLGRKEKAKVANIFHKNQMSLHLLQGIKACDPPLFGLKAKKLQCYYYLHEALFDGVFDLVLVYCFFSKLGIISYLTIVVSFDTNYIIFKTVENFAPKKY